MHALMLRYMKFLSRVEQDISFAYISAHPYCLTGYPSPNSPYGHTQTQDTTYQGNNDTV